MAAGDRERRRRAARRIALYGGAALLILSAIVTLRLLDRPDELGEDQTWTEIDFASLPEVRLLQEYVRIDTSADTGDEVAGARFLARQLEAAGIPARIERVGERGANLWAVLEGEDPRAVVLHHHIDVSPAGDTELWEQPPFGGVIDLPWIYGRGVFDMKSVGTAQLQALLRLKRQGRPLRRSVILLATGDEEGGSDRGTSWILRRHPELAERFWAVLTEGGVVEAVSATEVKYWGIEFAQKRFVDAVACSADRQRLRQLRRDLLIHDKWRPGERLPEEVASFLETYAETRDSGILRRLLAQPAALVRDAAGFRRLPPYLQAMLRSEVAVLPLGPDPEGGFRLPLVFHLLPGTDLTAFRREVLPPWITHGVDLVVGRPQGADRASPLDHPVYQELVRAVEERYPGVIVGPFFLAWHATDARFFRAAGIPAYGFSPFRILTADTHRKDERNERLALPGYVAGVELYEQLLERLVR